MFNALHLRSQRRKEKENLCLFSSFGSLISLKEQFLHWVKHSLQPLPKNFSLYLCDPHGDLLISEILDTTKFAIP